MSRFFKTIILIIVASLTFSFSACGNNSEENEPSDHGTGANATVSENVAKVSDDAEKQKKEYTVPATSTPSPTPTHETRGLAEYYSDLFPIGTAVNAVVVANPVKYKENILHNYNQITCENETKPTSLLYQSKSQKGLPGTYEHAEVHFDGCKTIVDFCVENNIQMRLHTLVWHSQTPRWFFTEDYTNNGELVSREVMLKRMENYIKDVLAYFDTNYPGLIYGVDVVNECFDPGSNGDKNGVRKKSDEGDNPWYLTVGDDYYYWAFKYARQYAPDYMTLYYNDYGMSGKYDMVIRNLQKCQDEGLIDGIGMQSHLSTTDRISTNFMLALRTFLNAGYCVQLTELDIGVSEATESNFLTQARKYKIPFQGCREIKEKGYDFRGITLWGVSDANSWRSKDNPLLFDKKLEPKPAYYGALLEDGIIALE